MTTRDPHDATGPQSSLTGPLKAPLGAPLTALLEAREPPEARGLRRDAVRLLVSRRDTGEVGHHVFADLPSLLSPGDLLVVNNSATLRLLGQETPRLWRARLDRDVLSYLAAHGAPIRYGYVERDWPLADYQTVFGIEPGSAEMPSAGRPFTPELVTALVSRGIGIAPITLHTGVASPEKDEPPYPEWFSVSPWTARLANITREHGGRVIAVGTTVVRALETAALDAPAPGGVRAMSGWTSHVVTPEVGVRVVDGLVTGLHEPRSSHLTMLTAITGSAVLARAYAMALDEGYLWHEFGDSHLIL